MGKIYALFGVIAGIIAALFTAFAKGASSAENKIKAKQERAAREYENAGSEALIGGLENEQKAKTEPVDTNKRDHFNK
jgi:gas vesicle protein